MILISLNMDKWNLKNETLSFKLYGKIKCRKNATFYLSNATFHFSADITESDFNRCKIIGVVVSRIDIQLFLNKVELKNKI